MSIAFEAVNINCLMYSNGKCGHPCARGWFRGKACVLDSGDPRVTQCAVRVEAVRPQPPPAPPPRNPNLGGYQPVPSSFDPALRAGRPKPVGPANASASYGDVDDEYWAPGTE